MQDKLIAKNPRKRVVPKDDPRQGKLTAFFNIIKRPSP